MDVPSRWWALFCSVVHYGLGNLASDSKPPRTETVTETAKRFEKYLDGEVLSDKHN